MTFLKLKSHYHNILLIIAFVLSFALTVAHEVLAQGTPPLLPPPPAPPPAPTTAVPVIGIAGGGVILLAMAAYGIYRLRSYRKRDASSRVSSK